MNLSGGAQGRAEPFLPGNALPGQVADVVYTGSSTTYLVRLDNGQQVMARLQNVEARPDTRYHSGDAVTITWPVQASKAFAE